MADVYFAYGKALLENAIQQAGVLGKQEQSGANVDDDNGASAYHTLFHHLSEGQLCGALTPHHFYLERKT